MFLSHPNKKQDKTENNNKSYHQHIGRYNTPHHQHGSDRTSMKHIQHAQPLQPTPAEKSISKCTVSHLYLPPPTSNNYEALANTAFIYSFLEEEAAQYCKYTQPASGPQAKVANDNVIEPHNQAIAPLTPELSDKEENR